MRRHGATRPKIAKGLPILFWCSLLYLVTELAFAAQLLELAGSRISEDQLNRVEAVGRSLSGIAVALFIIGWLVKRDWSRALKGVLIPVTLILSIVVVWVIQEVIVATAVTTMDLEQTNRAMVLVRATDLVREGHIEIKSLDLSAEVLRTPTGLSFMAMFPMLALGSQSIEAEIEPILDNAIRRSLILDCEEDVEGMMPIPCLGTPAQFAEEHWPEIAEGLEELYQRYDEARRPVVDPDAADIDAAFETAWGRYQRDMRRNRLDASTRHHRRVRTTLRRQGLDVPDSWALDDQAGFRRAVRDRYMEQARERWEDQHRFKPEWRRISPDLGRAGFFRHPATLETIWADWGIDHERLEKRPPPILTPKISVRDLASLVHAPLLSYILELERDALRDYTLRIDNKAWGKRSENARKWTVIPPMALAFSVIGALAHVIKVAGFFLVLVMPRRWAVGLPTLAVILASIWVYQEPNPIIDSQAYQALADATGAQFGAAVEVPIHYTIQVERHMYPVGAAIRRYALFNIDFTAW
ncbi:MAG: hypothetical protein KI792_03460 [Alphaproteobacteria bacterium]|nr:hypothetical protein [Alphaproteobacteria bacterium SS10]